MTVPEFGENGTRNPIATKLLLSMLKNTHKNPFECSHWRAMLTAPTLLLSTT